MTQPLHRRGATGMAAARKTLTVNEFCAELSISRSTFYDWRAKGVGPRCLKLPSGSLRIRRVDADQFIDSLEEAA